MAIDIQRETFLDANNRVAKEEKSISKGVEIRNYSNLVNSLEKNLIPLPDGNKYMLIEFPINETPRFALETFYEIQLLGYVPIIANAERNIEFRRHPHKLYTLIIKGALVQINASSLIGKNGWSLQKFAVKLCKHNFIHFISSGAASLVDPQAFPLTLSKYLQKKFSVSYLNYLQSNVKHLSKGTDFLINTPFKFK